MKIKRFQIDYLYFTLALCMSVGLVFVVTGSGLLDQIDIFKWTHDDNSLSLEIHHKIDVDILKGTFMEIVGYLIMSGGAIFAFLSYKKIEQG